MQIEIKETHPAGPGKKVATVIATGGQRFDVWPEKLAGFQVGRRYDVEVEDRDYNGRTFRKIVKATPVNGAAPTANGNGAAKGADNGGSAPAAAARPDGEAEFAGRAIAALILKGEVTYNQRHLHEATAMLRDIWRATSGGRPNGKGGDHA